jgi:hypothetical protein
MPFKASRHDFSDYKQWEEAAKALGYSFDMHVDVENGPSADDVFETVWALDANGKICGWSYQEPVDWDESTNTYTEVTSKSVLFDNPEEAYRALNTDPDPEHWVAKVAKCAVVRPPKLATCRDEAKNRIKNVRSSLKPFKAFPEFTAMD